MEINENQDKKNRLFSVLESLLFAQGEPIKLEKLAVVFELDQLGIEDFVNEYAQKIIQDSGSGLILLRNGNEVQLGTKPDNFSLLERFLKHDLEEDLSQAATGVLTVILYRGPILKSEIDFIRGVNSSYILRMLLVRGLVIREKRGLSFAYEPSFELLKLLGISSQKELPEFSNLNQRLNDLVKKVEDLEKEAEKDNGIE